MPFGTPGYLKSKWDIFDRDYLKKFRESEFAVRLRELTDPLENFVKPIPELEELTEKVTPDWLEPGDWKNPKLVDALGPLNPRFVSKNLVPLDFMIPGLGKANKIVREGKLLREGLQFGGVPSDLEKQLKASVELAKGMKKAGVEKPQVAINELKRTLGGMPSRQAEKEASKAAYERSLKPTTKMVRKIKTDENLSGLPDIDETTAKVATTTEKAIKASRKAKARSIDEISWAIEKKGKPGIAIEQGKHTSGEPITDHHYVVQRDANGDIEGILSISLPVEYPSKYPGESPLKYGLSSEIVISPSSQRKGIGTKLVETARESGLPVDEALISKENAYTEPGANFVNKLMGKKPESALDRIIREASESIPDSPLAKVKKAEEFSSPGLAQEADSVEEMRRRIGGQKFYKVSQSGELTHLGQKPDATLRGKEGVIILQPGKEPTLYSGDSSALERFNQAAKREPSLLETKFSEEPETYVLKPGESYPSGQLSTSKGERGAIGKTLPPPRVDIPGRFKLSEKVNGKKIRFDTDFDKAAYQLTRTKKPDADLLLELSHQTGMSENVILQHGRKLAAKIDSIDKITKPGEDIQLYKRYVEVPKKFKSPGYKKGSLGGKLREAEELPPELEVLGEIPKGPSRKRQILEGASGLSSELAFMLDLTMGRQSFRPVLSHPFKTGFPALKSALKSITKSGFEKEMASLGETPTGLVLSALKNVGEGNLSKLLPNVKELKKLPISDLEQFFSKSTWGEKIPGVGKLAVKPSKRMYDAGQFRTRINELERILGGEEGLYNHLVNPEKAEDFASAIKRVSEETGYGRLPDPFDSALNASSHFLTAPRNLVAKAQFYNPMSYLPKKWGGRFSGPAYKDFLIDQAKIAALIGGPVAFTPKSWTEAVGLPDSARMGAVGYLSDLAGADVETEPMASNFGIRYGNYKPDIMGGEAGIIKTLPKINPFKDDETRISSQGKEYPGDPSADLMRFGRSRIRPGPAAMLYDTFLGYNPDVKMRTNYMGENLRGDTYIGEGKKRHLDKEATIPYAKWFLDQVTPSYPKDIYQAAQQEPLAIPAAIGLGGLGFGGTSYDPFESNPYKPSKEFYRLPVKGRPKKHYDRPSKWVGESIK